MAIDKIIKENIEQDKKNVNKKQFMKIYREEFSDLNKQLIEKIERGRELFKLIENYEKELDKIMDEIDELEKNNIKVLIPKDFLD
mgnify:FL=1